MLGLKGALRRKLDMSIPKSDLAIEEDPYLQLGYGMNAYFQIVLQLMCMMFLIMCVTVPMMLIYSSQNALEQLPGYSFNAYTLGNFGGSQSLCAISTFQEEDQTIPLQCSAGLIQISAIADNTGKDIFDSGIIPSSNVNTYCTNTAFEDTAKCSSFFKTELLKTSLAKSCVGKAECKIKNLGQFIDREADGFNADECDAESSQMFLQVACIIPEADSIIREQ